MGFEDVIFRLASLHPPPFCIHPMENFDEVLGRLRGSRSSRRSKVAKRGTLGEVAKEAMAVLYKNNLRTCKRIIAAAREAECVPGQAVGLTKLLKAYNIDELVKMARAEELTFSCQVVKGDEVLRYRTTPKVKKTFRKAGEQIAFVLNGRRRKRIPMRVALMTATALVVAAGLYPDELSRGVDTAIAKYAKRLQRAEPTS